LFIQRERNRDTDRGRKSSAILLPFPVSVEPGVFRERAERSPGSQSPLMGQDCGMGRKILKPACRETTFK